MSMTKIATSLFIFMSVTALLILGKDFILPIILAVLIWFLIKELRQALQKIPLVGTKIPTWLWTLISSVFLFLILGIVISVLGHNINLLGKNIDAYQNNILKINTTYSEKFNIDFTNQITNFINTFNFSDLLKQLLNALSGLLSNSLLIVFYVVFLFFEEQVFMDKIKYIYKNPTKYEEAQEGLNKVNEIVSNYIFLKTIISILTGGLSYLILYFIGVDTPFFWAFLIFILNYIPVVGSLIATVFPAGIALLQFGDFYHFLLVLGLITSVQIFIGNYLEPKVFGTSLNMSPLVVMLSLTFWGMIWGMAGMFLSVPITVILIILLAQFKTTKPIAILLSDKGKV